MPRDIEFDQVMADTICEEIADGRSLRSICKDEGMPAKSTVFKWLAAVPAFADQYARAREAQADSHADDIIDISDNKSLDPNDKRVRIEARKWLAGKQRPKVYGDKMALIGGGRDDAPIRHSHAFDLSKASDEELDVLERFIGRTANAGRDPGGESETQG